MAADWYALHVKPHKEQPVYQLLRARQVEAYYPVLKVKPVNPRSRRERPFFPGYMFVYLDLEQTGEDRLRWMEGTYGLVSFGGRPATVPERLIRELRQRLIDVHAAGGPEQEGLVAGDHVRITGGPFEGYQAIFDARLPSSERVQVLLTFLRDQPKRLQLDASQIEKSSGRRP